MWLHRSRGSTHLLPPLVWLHKDDCLLVTRLLPRAHRYHHHHTSPHLSPPFSFFFAPSPLFPSSMLSKHQRDLSYPNGLNLLTGNNSRSTSRPLASHGPVTMCSPRRSPGERLRPGVEIPFSGGACSLCRTVRGSPGTVIRGQAEFCLKCEWA